MAQIREGVVSLRHDHQPRVRHPDGGTLGPRRGCHRIEFPHHHQHRSSGSKNLCRPCSAAPGLHASRFDPPVPRWSISTTSRSSTRWDRSVLTHGAMSVTKPPGPPATKTVGSGRNSGLTAGTTMTLSYIRRPDDAMRCDAILPYRVAATQDRLIGAFHHARLEGQSLRRSFNGIGRATGTRAGKDCYKKDAQPKHRTSAGGPQFRVSTRADTLPTAGATYRQMHRLT